MIFDAWIYVPQKFCDRSILQNEIPHKIKDSEVTTFSVNGTMFLSALCETNFYEYRDVEFKRLELITKQQLYIQVPFKSQVTMEPGIIVQFHRNSIIYLVMMILVRVVLYINTFFVKSKNDPHFRFILLEKLNLIEK